MKRFFIGFIASDGKKKNASDSSFFVEWMKEIRLKRMPKSGSRIFDTSVNIFRKRSSSFNFSQVTNQR